MCRLQAFTRIRAHASSKQTFVKLTIEALPSIQHWEDFILIFLCDIEQITQGKSRKQKPVENKTLAGAGITVLKTPTIYKGKNPCSKAPFNYTTKVHPVLYD